MMKISKFIYNKYLVLTFKILHRLFFFSMVQGCALKFQVEEFLNNCDKGNRLVDKNFLLFINFLCNLVKVVQVYLFRLF